MKLKGVLLKSCSMFLSLAMLIMLLPVYTLAADNEVIYVAGSMGNDDNDGKSSANAVASLQKAYQLVDDNGTIVICGDIFLKEEVVPAKSVTITSVIGDEDFSETASWIINNSFDTYFQADTFLDNLTIKTYMEGYGFIANGYKFHVGKNVKVIQQYNNKAQVYIAGGRSAYPTNDGASFLEGGDITVESGSCWLLYGGGEAVFGSEDRVLENTAPINITVKGNAQVKTIVAGFKTSTQPSDGFDSGICIFGDVNINVEDTASVREVYLGSECYNSGHSEQDRRWYSNPKYG